MIIPYSRLRRPAYFFIAFLMICFWGALFISLRQISDLDGRFFRLSLPGLKGLILYEMGDYGGAASAYRDHFKNCTGTGN